MKEIKVLGMDLDGTLVQMRMDFAKIRKEIGVPNGADPLRYIEGLPKKDATRMTRYIESMEREAAEQAELTTGAKELMDHCKSSDIKVVIITRNSEESTKRTLELLGVEVDMIVSREHAEPKPSPEPIHLVLTHFGLKPHQMGYVGDYIYDIQAGNSAGVKTVLLTSNEHAGNWVGLADYVAEDLLEVLDFMRGKNA